MKTFAGSPGHAQANRQGRIPATPACMSKGESGYMMEIQFAWTKVFAPGGLSLRLRHC